MEQKKYTYKIKEVGGIPYKLPQINTEKHPFKGVARKLKEEQKADMKRLIEEGESRIEDCVLSVDPKEIMK